jgi:RimJ/RimL family protein N-acetyltransferase
LATEACTALIGIARALGLGRLEASHFIDNPASARVLDKLGFESTGIVAPRMNCARGEDVPARLMRLRLAAPAGMEEDEALAA